MGYSRLLVLATALLMSPLYTQAQLASSPLHFADTAAGPTYAFLRSSMDEPYLVQLRTKYQLNQLLAKSKSDYERVRLISKWARTQWEHNGSNEPTREEPIAILEEAATGKQFRCVEYSIVLSGALNSVGIPARVVGLMMPDVETRPTGAGHVVAEAYLADLKKWVMIDGQWDVTPVLNGQPLNAVELQRALISKIPNVGVDSFSSVEPSGYFKWILPYLFYFDTKIDGRFGPGKLVYARHSDAVILGPIGANVPRVFQRVYSLKNEHYTHSLDAFYAPPGKGSKPGTAEMTK